MPEPFTTKPVTAYPVARTTLHLSGNSVDTGMGRQGISDKETS